MDRISELKQERAGLVAEMRAILDGADAEKRSALTAEEQQNYDRLESEVDALGARISQEEQLRARELELTARENGLDPRGAQGDLRDETADDAEYRQVFVKYARHGMGELDKEERQILRRGFVEQRDQSKATGGAGGFLVPTSFEESLYEHLVQAGAVRQTRVQVIQTSSGEALQLPKTSAHGAASLLGEGSAASSADETFAQLQVDAWTYARLIKASLQLIEDEVVDVEEYLAREIGRSIGALQNSHFVTGDASSKPNGITVAASIGKTGATGQTLTIIYDDVVDLIHSVAVPYRRQGEFLAADGLIKALRKLKDADGRPLWEPSVQAGQPDRLLGYPIFNDPDMPAPAANAKSLAFGDFNGYVIRDVRGVSLRRLDERFADALQVGFLGWMRSDGDLLDTNAIKTYAHSAT
jgi:HK97 family phage major capsid protein